MRKILSLSLVILLFSNPAQAAERGPLDAALMTVPERTAYQRTSTFAEVIDVLDALQARSSLMHRETLLTTVEGREVPVVVLADPPVTSPEQARATGKPVIYLQGNIHGGEVEGKEASLKLMREILMGDKGHLLESQILVFVPVYNADGNDAMTADSRPSQEGSPVLAGSRFAHGFDLNRDGMAVEAPETAALYRNVIQRWDPDLLVDLHTTNGSWHGYALTWAPSYHTAGEPATSDYTTERLLPAVQSAMRSEHGLETSWFGDFNPMVWPPTEFRTYHHAPRYLTNRMALRNRMAILSETFAHDRFYDRVHAAHAFITEILEYTRLHGAEMRALNRAADARVIAQMREEGGRVSKGVRFEMVPLPEPLALLSYTHEYYRNADGSVGVTRTPEFVTIEGVLNYNQFQATLQATVPKAYLLPSQFSAIADKLVEHGIAVDRIESLTEFHGETFVVQRLAEQGFVLNDHANVLLEGEFESDRRLAVPGDYYISMEQRLANLIFYLLEPQSDDGLAFWNFFDDYLEPGLAASGSFPYPVFKVLQ